MADFTTRPGDITLPIPLPPGVYTTTEGFSLTRKVAPPPEPPPSLPPTDGGAWPVGTWSAIPTTVRDVYPVPRPPGNPDQMMGFSGALLRSVGSRRQLVITGGGHQDYGGNEIYGVDVSPVGAWLRLKDPSPVIPPSGGPCSAPEATVYADGAPSSRHNYCGLVYLPITDEMMLVGGLKWCAAGDAVTPADNWRYSFITKTWRRMSPPPPAAFLSGSGLKMELDPASGLVYANRDDSNCALWSYAPGSDTWALVGGANSARAYTVTLDTRRRQLVYLGPTGSGSAIMTQSLADGSKVTLTLTGDTAPLLTPVGALGGIAYDPLADKVVWWAGGTPLYVIDLDAKTIRAYAGAGVSPQNPPSNAGTYGRFRYVPDVDVFILAASPTRPPLVYRPSWRTGTPLPPPPPVVVPPAVPPTTVPPPVVPPPVPPPVVPPPVVPPPVPPPVVSPPVVVPPVPLPPPLPPGTVPALQPGVFYFFEPPSFGGPARGSKHVSWAFHHASGRCISQGGDFIDIRKSASDSYRGEMYAFDFAARWADRGNRDAGWETLQPYCGFGGLQPKSPDFVGWVEDESRQGFWFVPGTSVAPSLPVCVDRTTAEHSDPHFIWRRVMFYSPSKPEIERWTDVCAPGPRTADNWMSFMDKRRDLIGRFGHDGGEGGVIDFLDPKTGLWRRKNLETAATGSVRLHTAALAVDHVGRCVYGIDPYSGKFWRFNMDTETVTPLKPFPGGPYMLSADKWSYAVWDSAHGVVIAWRNELPTKLYVYHSSDDTWEMPAWVSDPPGLHPLVITAIVYDEHSQVMLFLGSRRVDVGEVDPNAPIGIWAYRYA